MNRTNLIQSPVFITHLNLYGLNSIFIKANDGSSTKESEFFFFFFFWQIGSGRQKQTTCMQERYPTGGTKKKEKKNWRFASLSPSVIIP